MLSFTFLEEAIGHIIVDHSACLMPKFTSYPDKWADNCQERSQQHPKY